MYEYGCSYIFFLRRVDLVLLRVKSLSIFLAFDVSNVSNVLCNAVPDLDIWFLLRSFGLSRMFIALFLLFNFCN